MKTHQFILVALLIAVALSSLAFPKQQQADSVHQGKVTESLSFTSKILDRQVRYSIPSFIFFTAPQMMKPHGYGSAK